jgi:hypothetical protein
MAVTFVGTDGTSWDVPQWVCVDQTLSITILNPINALDAMPNGDNPTFVIDERIKEHRTSSPKKS